MGLRVGRCRDERARSPSGWFCRGLSYCSQAARRTLAIGRCTNRKLSGSSDSWGTPIRVIMRLLKSPRLRKSGLGYHICRARAGRMLQVFFVIDRLHKPFGILAAETPEDAGMDQELAERRGNQAAQIPGGDRIEDFASGLWAAVGRRNQGDAGGEPGAQ